MSNRELVQNIAIQLIKNDLNERAGELFEKTKDFDRALECFKRGKAYGKGQIFYQNQLKGN